jgi:hypothetical protein
MSARVDVNVSSNSTPKPAPAVVSGRLFLIGRANDGPITLVDNVPTRVTGMAEFRSLYGERVEDVSDITHDVLRCFFSEGGAEVFFLRAIGAAATQYDDDYDAADYEDLLAGFTADLGPGCVVIAGQDHTAVGEYVGAHCGSANRIGIVTGEITDTTVATIAAASAVVAGYTNPDRLVLAWPNVKIPTASGLVSVEPTGFVAGVRARAHGIVGPWQSPLQEEYGSARFVAGVTTSTTDGEFLTLWNGDVSPIRVVGSKVRLYGYKTAAAPVGDVSGNLQGAQFRDLVNVLAYEAGRIAERYVGVTVDGRGLRLSGFNGALAGMLNTFAQAGALFAQVAEDGSEVDPGYVVDTSSNVNSPASLAAGNLNAEIGVRLSPTAEFVTINITANDAGVAAL